jgi:hypothetical protein
MSPIPPHTVSALVGAAVSPGRTAHHRQRDLVRASLLACPGGDYRRRPVTA